MGARLLKTYRVTTAPVLSASWYRIRKINLFKLYNYIFANRFVMKPMHLLFVAGPVIITSIRYLLCQISLVVVEYLQEEATTLVDVPIYQTESYDHGAEQEHSVSS